MNSPLGDSHDDGAKPPAPVRLACLSTDAAASAALRAVIATLVPRAEVEIADAAVERDTPTAECVVLSVGDEHAAAQALTRALRARGYAGAIVVVADDPGRLAAGELRQVGADAMLATTSLTADFPATLTRVLALEERARHSRQAAALLGGLRRTQRLLAAGHVAGRLRHRLNNPLAALLGEAQLLELEELPEEHASAVRRIVELCRRVIEVTRSIDGTGADGT